MNTYTVTAGNKCFYQVLVVTADDKAAAATKFQAYLDAPQQKQGEQEEIDWAQEEFGEVNPDDHEYRFDEGDIEEEYHFPHWRGEPGEQVQVMSSDGNG